MKRNVIGMVFRHHRRTILLSALILAVAYFGSFAIWWSSSPHGIAYPFDNQPAPYVRLNYDPVLWKLWSPCLWWMEEVGGWPVRGCEAMASKVVYVDGCRK